MPRRISFSMTEPQFLAGTKDVTRRMGWHRLAPGDRLTAVRKAMGLKKGERQVVLGDIEVLSVRRERLDTITEDDVRREGFPGWTVSEFVEFFCKGHSCSPDAAVTRIEFRHACPRCGARKSPRRDWCSCGWERYP